MMTKTKYHVTTINREERNDFTNCFESYECALNHLGTLLKNYKELEREKIEKIVIQEVVYKWDEEEVDEMYAEIFGDIVSIENITKINIKI